MTMNPSRRLFRSPSRVAKAHFIRQQRAIRPIPAAEERIFLETHRSPVMRVFRNSNGAFFGTRLDPVQGEPNARRISICQLTNEGQSARFVGGGVITFGRSFATFSDIGKGMYANPNTYGETTRRVFLRPRGLGIIRPLIETILPEVRRRGITQLRLKAENSKLVSYYEQFGFRVSTSSRLLGLFFGEKWMVLDLENK